MLVELGANKVAMKRSHGAVCWAVSCGHVEAIQTYVSMLYETNKHSQHQRPLTRRKPSCSLVSWQTRMPASTVRVTVPLAKGCYK